MGETTGNDFPVLTDIQRRFLGFVAARVYTKVGDSERGFYKFADELAVPQILPVGGVTFSRQHNEWLTAEVTYEDKRPDRPPLLQVAFAVCEDDEDHYAAFADRSDNNKAFLVETWPEQTHMDDDSLAAALMDDFEQLETVGAVVKAGSP